MRIKSSPAAIQNKRNHISESQENDLDAKQSLQIRQDPRCLWCQEPETMEHHLYACAKYSSKIWALTGHAFYLHLSYHKEEFIPPITLTPLAIVHNKPHPSLLLHLQTRLCEKRKSYFSKKWGMMSSSNMLNSRLQDNKKNYNRASKPTCSLSYTKFVIFYVDAISFLRHMKHSLVHDWTYLSFPSYSSGQSHHHFHTHLYLLHPPFSLHLHDLQIVQKYKRIIAIIGLYVKALQLNMNAMFCSLPTYLSCLGFGIFNIPSLKCWYCLPTQCALPHIGLNLTHNRLYYPWP